MRGNPAKHATQGRDLPLMNPGLIVKESCPTPALDYFLHTGWSALLIPQPAASKKQSEDLGEWVEMNIDTRVIAGRPRRIYCLPPRRLTPCARVVCELDLLLATWAAGRHPFT